jgi:hypothetical protein
LIETKDSQNWQARYIIQHAFGGSVAECGERVGKMDCAAMCQQRVSDVRSALGRSNPNSVARQYNDKAPGGLTRECVSSCELVKAQALDAASRYYQIALPERITTEKQTLAQLTGWSFQDIDAMPGGTLASAPAPKINSGLHGAAVRTDAPWWRTLFSK